jgi:hypothetical protein
LSQGRAEQKGQIQNRQYLHERSLPISGYLRFSKRDLGPPKALPTGEPARSNFPANWQNSQLSLSAVPCGVNFVGALSPPGSHAPSASGRTPTVCLMRAESGLSARSARRRLGASSRGNAAVRVGAILDESGSGREGHSSRAATHAGCDCGHEPSTSSGATKIVIPDRPPNRYDGSTPPASRRPPRRPSGRVSRLPLRPACAS